MEELMDQFTLLSNQALHNKNFDPSNIEDLMKLFEIEAYKSWASMELECQQEEASAENTMQEEEEKLNTTMQSCMDEWSRFEEDLEKEAMAELESLEKEAMAEYNSLVRAGDAASRMGKTMEKVASVASKKYVEAAVNSATNSMKSAWKGLSNPKVHPS